MKILNPMRGFTIPELLVSLFIFSLVMVGAGGLLVSGISSQRRAGGQQELMDQASFLAEYMSRALRQARKDLTGSCLTTVQSGFNYELNVTKDRIRFLNRSDLCQQFFLSGPRIFEQESTSSAAANFGVQAALTADNITVQTLRFALFGESQTDNLQPKATLAMELRAKAQQGGFQPTLSIQTTVSQRNIDVPQ